MVTYGFLEPKVKIVKIPMNRAKQYHGVARTVNPILDRIYLSEIEVPKGFENGPGRGTLFSLWTALERRLSVENKQHFQLDVLG